MLIDGEKWACDACVRGHRVSNCQHSDRPLQHINKKGRPVSQCHHCRGLRKSRSAHVKCDCGDAAHKHGQCGHHDKNHRKDHLLCSCSHGGRCSCAVKKEHHRLSGNELEAISERDHRRAAYPKARLTTAHSEGALTVFANGHHKPTHKHNHMAQKCGVPYTIPRPHTAHGSADLGRRSVDSLPATNSVETTHAPSPMHDSILSAQQDVRLVRSEHGSPHPTAACSLDDLNGPMTPLDLSFPEHLAASAPTAATRPHLDLQSVTSVPFDSYFCATPDTDHPVLSAGLDTPSVDWSHLDLPINHHHLPYGPPPGYAGFDYRGLAAAPMSSASSGEPSEFGDYGPFGNPSPIQPPSLVHNRFPSDSSDVGETDSYRLSGTSSFHGMPQMAMLASSNIESLDIDDYLAGTSAAAYAGADSPSQEHGPYGVDRYPLEASEKLPPTSAPAEESYGPVPYPVEKPSKLGPTSVPREDVSFSLPASDDAADAPWVPQYTSSPTAPGTESDTPHAVWSS